MSSELVFVPVSVPQAEQLATGQDLTGPVQAFMPTAELAAALGYPPGADEELERATMLLASVWGLAQFGVRLVMVAEVGPERVSPGAETDNGGVALAALRSADISAWFADEFTQDAEQAGRQASGLGLDDAWELDSVVALVSDHDLLWHAADELTAEFGPSTRT